MSPVTHVLASWVLARLPTGSERRERVAVTLAGVVPDLDGLGAIPDLFTRWFTEHPTAFYHSYHRLVAHNLVAAVLVAAIVAWVAGPGARFRAAALSLVAFHLHLLGDLVGSAGPDGFVWPVRYLWPLHDSAWSWAGQWALNAWPNVAITVGLLVIAGGFAVRRGTSPVEVVSRRADKAVVQALRARCGCESEGGPS
ncbi:MAG: metal-dependent hydrolase [Planctomycetota bacterium]